MSSYFRFEATDNQTVFPPRTHYHPDYEVYCLTQGKCRYFIDDKTYSMAAGDIVVIPPGVIHKVIYESESHSRMLFNCTGDYVPPSVLPVLPRMAHFTPEPDSFRRVESLYRRIREAYRQPDSFWEDSLRCAVMELFLLMARRSAFAQELPAGTPFVRDAVGYIRANYMHRITLSDTAANCAVSPEHLSRVFKRETGFGFSEYLNLYRLKKAEAMLKSGQGKNISQVAAACGFSDSNYFSGMYKKMFGLPPSKAWRREEQEDSYV